jgi:hypothetical protein
MRILPVTKEWPKLRNPSWPTFRLTRRDKDYYEGEVVQVVLHPRSKHRKVLGIAEIVKKEQKGIFALAFRYDLVSLDEAIEDGFENLQEMQYWFYKTHGDRVRREPLNKLTVVWKERFDE